MWRMVMPPSYVPPPRQSDRGPGERGGGEATRRPAVRALPRGAAAGRRDAVRPLLVGDGLPVEVAGRASPRREDGEGEGVIHAPVSLKERSPSSDRGARRAILLPRRRRGQRPRRPGRRFTCGGGG